MNTPFFLPTLTRLSCYLTGDDFFLLRELNDPKSNKKIQLLAMLMMLPMILWAVSVYWIMRGVFDASPTVGLVTAFFMAVIIGIVERSIIMSSGNRWTKILRYLLAFVLAIVGSFFIDEIVFAKDIEHKIEENQKISVQRKIQQAGEVYEFNVIQKKRDEVKQAHENWLSRANAVSAEAGGLATGVKGAGSATRMKKQLETEAKLHLDVLQKELNGLVANKATALSAQNNEITRMEMGRSQEGLMLRMEAMFQLIFSAWYMTLFWVLVTLLFLLVEILPVTIKSGEDLTFYERLVEFRSRSVPTPQYET